MLLFVTILQLIAALLLILIVLFQSGKSQGLSGAIGGIADSYMAKSKAVLWTPSWPRLPSGWALCLLC